MEKGNTNIPLSQKRRWRLNQNCGEAGRREVMDTLRGMYTTKYQSFPLTYMYALIIPYGTYLLFLVVVYLLWLCYNISEGRDYTVLILCTLIVWAWCFTDHGCTEEQSIWILLQWNHWELHTVALDALGNIFPTFLLYRWKSRNQRSWLIAQSTQYLAGEVAPSVRSTNSQSSDLYLGCSPLPT